MAVGSRSTTTSPSDDLTFNLKANLISAGATLDWHPFSNGFRLSAGGRYHNVDLSGTGDFTRAPSPSMATTYTHARRLGPITASVKSPITIAPYLGLGYDSTHFSDSRWALALDLGVIYGGQADVDDHCGATRRRFLGLRPTSIVEQKKLDDSVGKYGQFWPVATLALKFRF